MRGVRPQPRGKKPREQLPPLPGAPVPMPGPGGRSPLFGSGALPGRDGGPGRFYLDESIDTQFNGAWVVLGILLTFLGLLFHVPFLFAAASGLFLVAAVGWGWNRLSLFGLHYTRRFSERRAFLGETVELTLEVRNQKFLPLTWLEIVDVFPAALPLDGKTLTPNPINNLGEYHTFWTLNAFQRLTRRFQVTCSQRGYHAYGPTTLTTGDAFGLFSRTHRGGSRERLIVYPRLYSAEELRLPVKNPFGERRARGLFEDPLRTAGIRGWQAEDSLRRIHWKATARHGELLSRLYEPSEQPQVLIFLNVATFAKPWLGTIPELQERTISVAASLAAACADMRLPVGLVSNGFLPESDQALRLMPGRSPDQLVHILELLAAVTAFALRPIEEMLLLEAPALPWGATLLVVTAVAHDELLLAVGELARAGRQVVLFTLAERPPAEALPGVLVYHLPHLVDDVVAPVEVS